MDLALIAALVMVLVQQARRIPALAAEARSWLLPWVAIGLGLVVTAAWTIYQPPADAAAPQVVGQILWGGLQAGLIASGLWSAGGKAATGAVTRLLGSSEDA